MRAFSNLISAILVLYLIYGRANADEAFVFVKFICREELNYLEIEPIIIWNAKSDDALDDRDLIPVFGDREESADGTALRVCRFGPPPRQVFSIHSRGRRPPTETGASMGGWSEKLEVRVNGLPMAMFHAGSVRPSFRMILSGGQLTVCRKAGSQSGETQFTCKWMWLNDWIAAPKIFRENS